MTLVPTTSQAGDVGYSIPTNIIDANVVYEIREQALFPLFAEMIDISGTPGLNYVVPRITTAPSVSTLTNGANEADQGSTAAIVLTNPNGTASIKYAGVIQSWQSIEGAAVNWEVEMPKAIGRALTDKIDVDVLALCGGFSNEVGTSGLDCSLDDLRAAVAKFLTVAKGSANGGVFCLHPQQLSDVHQQMLSGAGAGLSTMLMRQDIMSLYDQTMGHGMLNAYKGHLFGVPLFVSNNVPDDNSAADHGGAIFVPKQAMALAYKWLGRVEMNSQAVNFKTANSWLGSAFYIAIEKDDNKGVMISTDHA